jgi:hypothetical protein
MTNEPNNGGLFKYLWPWLGMAAVIGLMWIVMAE